MPTDLFLVDTSIWIMALRKDFQPAAKDRMEYLLIENRVAICEIIRLEILGGARTEKEFHMLKSRLNSLHHLETMWNDACQLAFTLRHKGVVVPYTDILIASSALYAGATLLHFDRHFDLIAGITDLIVESFPAPPK
jgi:predicted nucleic acid-binding protein